MSFRGNPFCVSSVGSKRPDWLMQSFELEVDLRNRWWTIGKGDVVVDVGAGYGSYTLTALASGALMVMSIEPGKMELFDLVTNVGINGYATRCLPINVMAGHSEAWGFYYPDTHSSTHQEGLPEERIIASVDYLLKSYNFPPVNWVKIDVDGAEEHVLRGMTTTLGKDRPRLLIENHVALVPDVDKKLRSVLIPLGYVEEQVVGKQGTNENWSFWTPKEKKVG